MKQIYVLSFILSLFLFACKTATKAYQKGNYNEAIALAIRKLQKNPADAEAKALIRNAYVDAVRDHEEQIRILSGSNNDTRWERIYNEYSALQRLYETIRTYPSVARAVNAVDYSDYANTYRNKAAEVYAERAASLMNREEREAFKEAYHEWGKALKFRPEDLEFKKQRQQAYEKAVVNVLIVPLDNYGGYMYSNSYPIRNFQNDIIRNLSFSSNNTFVRFLTEWDGRGRDIKPDEVIEMRLGRFGIGRPYDEQYSKDVSKEVVDKEIVYKPDSVVKKYRTVQARITVTRRTLVSDGELYINVRDGKGRWLWNDNFRGEHRWQTEYATYTGDERALSNEDRALLNKRDNRYPPREEEIIEEILRRIENEAVSRIRNYYNRHL